MEIFCKCGAIIPYRGGKGAQRKYCPLCKGVSLGINSRKWKLKNPEKVLRAGRALEEKSRIKRKAQRKVRKGQEYTYRRNRRKIDVIYHLKCRLRSRLYYALDGRDKSARTVELIGCKWSELRMWLEFQFQDGMTWENYGPVWHVDHIRPCASYDLSDPEQQRDCFNYKNLQPLFALDNIKKGAKYSH